MPVLTPADFFLDKSYYSPPFCLWAVNKAPSKRKSWCQFPFSTLEWGTPAVSCFFALSRVGGGLFKKEGATFFFGKFAPRLEREAESQGQKKGGESPKLQACRNLGKPLFCSYYPWVSKSNPLGGVGGKRAWKAQNFFPLKHCRSRGFLRLPCRRPFGRTNREF